MFIIRFDVRRHTKEKTPISFYWLTTKNNYSDISICICVPSVKDIVRYLLLFWLASVLTLFNLGFNLIRQQEEVRTGGVITIPQTDDVIFSFSLSMCRSLSLLPVVAHLARTLDFIVCTPKLFVLALLWRCHIFSCFIRYIEIYYEYLNAFFVCIER